MALAAMAESTFERYGVTIREFGAFLNGVGISELRQIDKPLVERFKVWRVARIKRKKFARGLPVPSGSLLPPAPHSNEFSPRQADPEKSRCWLRG
jgi:hypothetical protein